MLSYLRDFDLQSLCHFKPDALSESDRYILFWEYIGDNDHAIINLKTEVSRQCENNYLFLVVDDTYEGLLTQSIIEDISAFCENLNVSYIIYSSNEKLVGRCVHFFSFHLCYKNYDGIDVQKNSFTPNLQPRHKIFLSLNRQTRMHRLQLVDYLIEKNLLEHSFVSCTKDHFDLAIIDRTDINWSQGKKFNVKSYYDENIIKYKLDKNSIRRLDKSLPLVLDYDYSSKNNPNTKHLANVEEFYQNSYWSLIGERDFYSDEYAGWTEKVLKSLFYCHPFIVVGLPHTLKSLQSLGFITFGSVIDESYDNTEDDLERFKKIKEQIDYLSSLNYVDHFNLYRKILPILEYNRKHYLDLNRSYQPSTFINRLLEWYYLPYKAT